MHEIHKMEAKNLKESIWEGNLEEKGNGGDDVIAL